ncbi:MAG: guanylate kinase [Actinobacteria bacterium]|nr:guanylate kinase [Actinomycetota bacterium]
MFVISGPSGAGKSTLINDAIKSLKKFHVSVSVTTRPRRKNEIEGKKYRFITEEEFDSMINQSMLLEYAEYCGYKYGTPKMFVEKEIENGNNIILEIEVQGAMQVKKFMPEAYMIFIITPSMHVLKERLHKRNTEEPHIIEKRLVTANSELDYQKYYDCIIVNNDYNEALLNLRYILKMQAKNIKD